MHFSQILALASSAALVAAAPAPVQVGVDDVVLYSNDGRYTMMKRSDLEELERLRKSGVVPPKPGYLEENLITFTGNETVETDSSNLQKRDLQIIIPNPHSRFLGWDVLMSQVTKGAPTTITIAEGKTISNSITVGASASYGFLKNFLIAQVHIDYTRSWATTQTQQFAAPVPEGKWGAFVTNAWTNRESGNIWSGTIGGDGKLDYYQADSFENKGYGDLSWVDGVISLCLGDSIPLKRCLGEGTL